MDKRIERNRRYLTDLFAGPLRGHAVLMNPGPAPDPLPLDLTISDRPIGDWVDQAERNYARQIEWLEALDDDSVPYAKVNTNTGLFAAAFGCPLHVHEDSPASARPVVGTPSEADRLPQPTLETPTLARVFEFCDGVLARLGPDVPVSVPDIQSAFDVAALVWNKQDLYTAIYDAPESVHRLVGKCQKLLKDFFDEFLRRVPNANLCHCPRAWAPPELGVWLSEDEAGSMSTPMFEQFCLPALADLSETYGGLFMHCCAAADHQYRSFLKIPNLRGLNRVFQQGPGFEPAIAAFSGRAVLMMAWQGEDYLCRMLDAARPDTRFLFDIASGSLDEARGIYERMRARCPRG
jgi:hypothetical protein